MRPRERLVLSGALLVVLSIVAPHGAAAQRRPVVAYLTSPSPGDPLAVAQRYVRDNRVQLGLTDADLAEWVVTDRYQTSHNGITHVYLQQRLAGIEVFNGLINVDVARDGSIVTLGNRFVADLVNAANTRTPILTAADAVLRAAAALGLVVSGPLTPAAAIGGPAQEIVFRGGDLSRDEIPVRLMYLPLPSGAVRLVWHLLLQPDSQHTWRMAVDAVTGAVLDQITLVLDDAYRVYAWPAESPNHVAAPLPLPPADGRTTIDETATDFAASPFGWHDLNGMPGADTSNTTGNNVVAVTDLDDNDAFTPLLDVLPNHPARTFVFPLDLTAYPAAYREAAVTNLFYWVNVAHDIHYRYGFDEVSGNFQQNNYGKGGLGGDAVGAEAQDSGGVDNANMSTHADGQPPRMQVYLWLPRQPNQVVVTAPSALEPFPARGATFGPILDEVGISGAFALVDDGTVFEDDACEPIQNDVNGKIALIILRVNDCSRVGKVLNAQSHGAIAVVFRSVIEPTSVGGFDDPMNPVTIPAVVINGSDFAAITQQLPGVAGTVRSAGPPLPHRDADLDSGVILHEYGHGISQRLTGGPSMTSCLHRTQAQGMGEGWSDWWALALTARAGANGGDPRGIATYLFFEDPPAFGGGIRPFPYSTDMTVNPQTYGDVAGGTLSAPHGIGSVWATTLWEMYWALLDGVPQLGLAGLGFRQNLYDLTPPLAGNQIALQLVMDGLKLQPCDPSFLDARDAILLADQVNYGGAHLCHLWSAFAARGMGTGADDDAGDPNDDLDVVADFALPPECLAAIAAPAPLLSSWAVAAALLCVTAIAAARLRRHAG